MLRKLLRISERGRLEQNKKLWNKRVKSFWFCFLETLLQLCFPSFHLTYVKRRESWIGFSQNTCLLIQIQNEPCYYKGLKDFKIETRNAIFGYFRNISYFKSPSSNLSKFKVSCKNNFKFETKNTLFRYFRAAILKNYFPVSSQYFRSIFKMQSIILDKV